MMHEVAELTVIHEVAEPAMIFEVADLVVMHKVTELLGGLLGLDARCLDQLSRFSGHINDSINIYQE